MKNKGKIYKHITGFYLFITGVDSTEWLVFKEYQTYNDKTFEAELGTIPSILVINNPNFTIEEYPFKDDVYNNKVYEYMAPNSQWRTNNPRKYFV